MKKIVVIGAGAAGMLAAITAAQSGSSVTLIEKNEKTGKKIFITGKGRCNVTNGCERDEFFDNIVTNSKFLYRAGETDFSAVRPFLGCDCRTESALEKRAGEGAFSYDREGTLAGRNSGRRTG